MKIILLLMLLMIDPINDLDKIARVNEAKKEAERAYLAENYQLAREKYTYLKDSLGVKDDRILLNLANAQFYTSDSVSALNNYKSLQESSSREIASLANQQLGAMQFRSKKYKEALQFYKASLKADPSNDEARYNYELLKKLIKEQEEQQQNQDQQQQDQKDQEQQQDQKNQDQQSQDQQNQDQKDQEQNQEEQKEQQKDKNQENQEEKKQDEKQQDEQQKEEQQEQKEDNKPNPIDEEKLKEMKISEEKAMLILEAMKNNEIQYIQQNKRKAKKKKDPSKPDW